MFKTTLKKLPLAAAAILLIFPALVMAHHGDAGRYENEVSVISGTVVQLRWIDPHSVIVFDVEEDGKKVRYQAELGGRTGLARLGWTATTLRLGDRITVTGRRVKSGAPYINLTERANIVLTNSGKEIFRTDNYGQPPAAAK